MVWRLTILLWLPGHPYNAHWSLFLKLQVLFLLFWFAQFLVLGVLCSFLRFVKRYVLSVHVPLSGFKIHKWGHIVIVICLATTLTRLQPNLILLLYKSQRKGGKSALSNTHYSVIISECFYAHQHKGTIKSHVYCFLIFFILKRLVLSAQTSLCILSYPDKIRVRFYTFVLFQTASSLQYSL